MLRGAPTTASGGPSVAGFVLKRCRCRGSDGLQPRCRQGVNMPTYVTAAAWSCMSFSYLRELKVAPTAAAVQTLCAKCFCHRVRATVAVCVRWVSRCDRWESPPAASLLRPSQRRGRRSDRAHASRRHWGSLACRGCGARNQRLRGRPCRVRQRRTQGCSGGAVAAATAVPPPPPAQHAAPSARIGRCRGEQGRAPRRRQAPLYQLQLGRAHMRCPRAQRL
jgi:hypothetical protein